VNAIIQARIELTCKTAKYNSRYDGSRMQEAVIDVAMDIRTDGRTDGRTDLATGEVKQQFAVGTVTASYCWCMVSRSACVVDRGPSVMRLCRYIRLRTGRT